MADKPWKRHERKVARFFGVERGHRGADFSKSGCEVEATMQQWGSMGTGLVSPLDTAGVIVECKHGYNSSLPRLFKTIHTRNPDPKTRITLMIWGPWCASWMEDRRNVRVFDTVWSEVICKTIRLDDFLRRYYVEWIGRKPPGYLDKYMDQAKGYLPNDRYYPLVALHGKGLRGRIIVWEM